MNERVYDRLANTLMLVAIASALLFDSGKLPQVAMGIVGGAAATASVALYFFKQRVGPSNEKGDRTVEEQKQPTKFFVDSSVLVAAQEMKLPSGTEFWTTTMGEQVRNYVMHAYVRDSAVLFAAHHSSRRLKFPHMIWYGDPGQQGFFEAPEAALSPNDVAECAIEIIRTLSVGDDRDRWEFNFGPNGLRVTARKSHDQPSTRPQEDFDFGQLTTRIQ